MLDGSHLVRYEDGEHQRHFLAREEAAGRLKWRGEAPLELKAKADAAKRKAAAREAAAREAAALLGGGGAGGGSPGGADAKRFKHGGHGGGGASAMPLPKNVRPALPPPKARIKVSSGSGGPPP